MRGRKSPKHLHSDLPATRTGGKTQACSLDNRPTSSTARYITAPTQSLRVQGIPNHSGSVGPLGSIEMSRGGTGLKHSSYGSDRAFGGPCGLLHGKPVTWYWYESNSLLDRSQDGTSERFLQGSQLSNNPIPSRD